MLLNIDISVHYEHYSDFAKLTTTEVLVQDRTSWSSFSIQFQTIKTKKIELVKIELVKGL
jgi:hypothetical protein